MPLFKKYVEIVYDGKPIFVANIIEGDTRQYLDARKIANANLTKLVNDYDTKIKELTGKVESLAKEVKILKGEE